MLTSENDQIQSYTVFDICVMTIITKKLKGVLLLLQVIDLGGGPVLKGRSFWLESIQMTTFLGGRLDRLRLLISCFCTRGV